MNIKDLKNKQIYELTSSLLKDYGHLLEKEDIEQINLATNNDLQLEEKEKILLPIVKKVWDKELESGNYVVISWNKAAKPPKRDDIVFATLSTKDNIVSFCDACDGIEYEISFDALIGALECDAATLIEDASKEGDYTIGRINDKVINSYNGATRLITPKQLLDSSHNTYKSKHNELILNSHLIKVVGSYTREKNYK